MSILSPFKRFYKPGVEVAIGDLVYANKDDDGFRIAFNITRTMEPAPDMGLVRIYNMVKFRREQLTTEFNLNKKAPVILRVGYDQILQDIFRGDVYTIQHIPENGVDYITELNTGDGLEAYRDTYMNSNIAPNVTLQNLFSVVQVAMKVSAGVDAQKAFNEAYNRAKVTLFKNGFVATARAADVMDEIAKTISVKWWIRDGQIQMVPRNTVTTDFAIELSPATGLINYIPEDQDFCQFDAELNPQAFPGRQIILKDEKGVTLGAPFYRIERVEYSGDTHGDTGFTMKGFARNPRIPL